MKTASAPAIPSALTNEKEATTAAASRGPRRRRLGGGSAVKEKSRPAKMAAKTRTSTATGLNSRFTQRPKSPATSAAANARISDGSRARRAVRAKAASSTA